MKQRLVLFSGCEPARVMVAHATYHTKWFRLQASSLQTRLPGCTLQATGRWCVQGACR